MAFVNCFNFIFGVGVLVLVFGGIWGNHLADGSARLGHIPSLPRKPQLPLKPCITLQPSDFKGNCGSIPIFSLIFITDSCTVSFAPQMWAARPHLGSIFEKLLHRKTFYLPAARCLQLCDFDAMFHVKRSQNAHSTSFEKTVETSMILVLIPYFIEKIHKPFDRLNFNKRWLKTNE